MRNVFPVRGFKVRRRVTLLTHHFRIKRPFPIRRVTHTCSSHLYRHHQRVSHQYLIVVTFTTGSAVGPSVLIDNGARVVRVNFHQVRVKRCRQAFPGIRVIRPIETFNCNGRQLPIYSLRARRRRVLSIPFRNAAIRNDVGTSALRAAEINNEIRIVAPFRKGVLTYRCQVGVATSSAIHFFLRFVEALRRHFVTLTRYFCLFFRVSIRVLFSFRYCRSVFCDGEVLSGRLRLCCFVGGRSCSVRYYC